MGRIRTGQIEMNWIEALPTLTRTQDPANGTCDFSGREPRSSDLVEQGLKRVMISTVDQRDLHWQFREAAHGCQAAEPGADNYDPRTVMCVVWHSISWLTIRRVAMLRVLGLRRHADISFRSDTGG